MTWNPVSIILLNLETVVKGQLLASPDIGSGKEDNVALAVKFHNLQSDGITERRHE